MNTQITGEIIGAFFRVYNELGYGFLEKLYSNAFEVELIKEGIPFVREKAIEARYKDVVVGVYHPDFIIENQIIVELKAGVELHEGAIYQTLNYLRLSDLELGLVLHFGPSPKVRRVVNQKNHPTGQFDRWVLLQYTDI